MSAPIPGIPALHETSYSRERLLNALRDEESLPDGAVAVATLYAHEIESDILAVIERAGKEDLDPASARLFYRGIHILGGRRFSSAYRPFATFLQGSSQRVEDLLGDAITETLPKSWQDSLMTTKRRFLASSPTAIWTSSFARPRSTPSHS
jgi:hypothetical protein